MRSDTGSNGIHIKNVEYCHVISLGHTCTIDIAATVANGWGATDSNPWVLGNLPAPKNKGFQFIGYNSITGTPIRFIVNEDSWVKPWYNTQDLTDGTIFMIHVSYITA